MLTHVAFEFDEPTDGSQAILVSLDAALRTHCPDIRANIVPLYALPLQRSRIAAVIVEAAATAQTELEEHSDAQMCIHISPRVINAKSREIPATVFAVRSRERIIAARVQVMHEESLRPVVRKLIAPEVCLAHATLFGTKNPSRADNAFGDAVAVAIHTGYMQAHAFLMSYKGTA